MNKRVIAAATAGVLALLGVLVLVVWANGANERAYAGAKRETVLQVTSPIATGTKATEIAGAVKQAKLPADAIPDGAVTDLADVAGLSTTSSLQPGEVLLTSRLAAPGDKGKSPTDVPEGYQEISVAVDTQHGVAGAVKPGDRVGVIASFNTGTTFSLQDVLVTQVKEGVGSTKDLTGLMVTLAVKTEGAQKLAHAAEWGKVWLTLQNADTDRTGAKKITNEDVLR